MSQKKKQNRATRDRLERERMLPPLRKIGWLTLLIAMFSKRKGERDGSNYRAG